MKIIQFNRQSGKNILIMLGFGLLSIILGSMNFLIPGMSGGGSDLREIGVLLSVLFLPNWLYMLGVCFISSLSIPFDHLEYSTILMHCTAGLFAWFFYAYLNRKIQKVYLLGGIWIGMVIVYYTVFLIPTLIIVFYFFKVIRRSDMLVEYKKVFYAYRFELFTTAAVTSLFLVLYKMIKILEINNKELKQALMKSEESDRLKTAFLTNINHEIRTPLNGIIGFTNLIIEPELTNDQRMEYGRIIVASSNQLLSTVSNIIDLSVIQTGQVNIRKENVSVNELFEGIFWQYSMLASEKNLHFFIDCDWMRGDDLIFTDKVILKQIMESLLNNAFKFTDEGSVRLGYLKNGDVAIFSVEDTGPGIDPGMHAEIFGHFSKVEDEQENFHPGAGLGLSISKALVELLGGKISLTSGPGKGSLFSFTIPCSQA